MITEAFSSQKRLTKTIKLDSDLVVIGGGLPVCAQQLPLHVPDLW